MSEGVMPVGCKWVFVRKRNEKNKIMKYKARLVAQGFSQRLGIDYKEKYALFGENLDGEGRPLLTWYTVLRTIQPLTNTLVCRVFP